MRLERRHFDD
jgi:ribosomal protein L14